MKGLATLRGRHMATVDPKGRLKIPTAFKTELEAYGPDFFVTSLDGQFAQVYPFPVWREMEEKLAALPSTHKPKRKFLDRANYFGHQVRIDSQGRILIPTQLYRKADAEGQSR